MAGMACDIVTPVAKMYSCDDVYQVIVPGTEGEMGFLINHVPLVSALADGKVRVQEKNGAEFREFAIQGGYVQMTGSKVIVLADKAEEI